MKTVENGDVYYHAFLGEKVVLTGNVRTWGQGKEVEVIYTDNSKGWVHIKDLLK